MNIRPRRWKCFTHRINSFVLRNEKYVGDLVLQKYYTKDYLTKKKMVNHGERAMYFIDDNHTGIIDRIIFDQVQAEIGSRASKYNPCKNASEEETEKNLKRTDGKYLFSGKIICGICGKPFCRKKTNAGTEYAKASWACGQYSMFGKKACASRRVPERVLLPLVAQMLGVTEADLPGDIDRITTMTVFPDGTLKALVDRHDTARSPSSGLFPLHPDTSRSYFRGQLLFAVNLVPEPTVIVQPIQTGLVARGMDGFVESNGIIFSLRVNCSIRWIDLSRCDMILLRQLYIANEMRRIKRQMQGGGGRRCRSIGD